MIYKLIKKAILNASSDKVYYTEGKLSKISDLLQGKENCTGIISSENTFWTFPMNKFLQTENFTEDFGNSYGLIFLQIKEEIWFHISCSNIEFEP